MSQVTPTFRTGLSLQDVVLVGIAHIGEYFHYCMDYDVSTPGLDRAVRDKAYGAAFQIYTFLVVVITSNDLTLREPDFLDKLKSTLNEGGRRTHFRVVKSLISLLDRAIEEPMSMLGGDASKAICELNIWSEDSPRPKHTKE